MRIFIYVVFFTSSLSFAADGLLDGKTYCRTVTTDGFIGQPRGKQEHCIGFIHGLATDNANTFFGNPPEYSPYMVSQGTITFGSSKYTLSDDGTELVNISGSTIPGTVFKLKTHVSN